MKLINQGWECPKCNTVYAPWIAVCPKCKKTSIGYEYTVGTEKTHEIIKKLHEPSNIEGSKTDEVLESAFFHTICKSQGE